MSGALGGVLGRMVDSVGYGGEKNYNRMLEAFLPGILGNTLKAHRLNTEGLSTRSGDTLIKPEEINELDAFFVAMGLTPSQLATQRDDRSSTYNVEQFYEAKTTTLKRRYTSAAKQQDTAELAKLRVEWDAMQEARERDNLKRQPLSTLLKAPREQAKRERDVVNGVPTTRTNRRFVEIMTGSDDDEGDE